MEFDEEFSGTPVEGTGEEALAPSAPISKGPKPKREKKEPGEEFLCVCVALCISLSLCCACVELHVKDITRVF